MASAIHPGPAADTAALNARAARRREWQRNITGYLFVAPNLIGFLLFTLAPVLFSLVVAFSDWNLFKGISGMNFVGLQNFTNLLHDIWFIDSLKNNLIYTVATIPVMMILSLIIAVVLNDKVYGRVAIRAMFFIPYIANIVAICAVWLLLYNPDHGVINQFLTGLGIAHPPQWLASTVWALPAIMIMTVWGGIGYNSVLYMAGLQSIPKSLYESADIDGASAFGKLRHITVPMLSPTIFFLLITNIIYSFQVFGPINILTQGGPGRSSTVLAYYIYLSGFRYFKMGPAAAMAWFLMVVIFAVTLVQWRGQKKWVNY